MSRYFRVLVCQMLKGCMVRERLETPALHLCSRTVVLKLWSAKQFSLARKLSTLIILENFYWELILVACEGFLKDKCGPRAKKFEHHCSRTLIQPTPSYSKQLMHWCCLNFLFCHFTRFLRINYLCKFAWPRGSLKVKSGVLVSSISVVALLFMARVRRALVFRSGS